jgi:CysZ protein
VSDKPVRRPTFVTGFTQVFAALGFVWNTPATWPLVLVPAVLFGLLATAASIVGVVWVTPWALSLLLLYLVSLIGGVWVALLLTPPLSGPALESLVAEQERALQLPERPPSGFFGELWLGFRAQAVAVGFALPVLVLLAVVELFVPPAAFITTPLGAMVTALALAWNLFDYPLTLHGVSASDRLGFVAANVGPVLGFGLGFSAMFWIPCFGILMLPVGVVAATRLLHLLVEHDPDQLPSLTRALAAADVHDPLSGATRPRSRERVGPAGNRGEG